MALTMRMTAALILVPLLCTASVSQADEGKAAAWKARIHAEGKQPIFRLTVRGTQLVAGSLGDVVKGPPSRLLASPACGAGGAWKDFTPAPPAGNLFVLAPTPKGLFITVGNGPLEKMVITGHALADRAKAWKTVKDVPVEADYHPGDNALYVYLDQGRGQSTKDGLSFTPMKITSNATVIAGGRTGAYLDTPDGLVFSTGITGGTIRKLGGEKLIAAAGSWVLWHGADGKVLISSDEGATTHETKLPVKVSQVQGRVGKMAAVDDRLFITDGKTIAVTKDGATWTTLPSEGRGDAAVRELAVCGGDLLALTDAGEIYATPAKP